MPRDLDNPYGMEFRGRRDRGLKFVRPYRNIGELNPTEQLKLSRHPFEVAQAIIDTYSKQGVDSINKVPGELERFKWVGMYPQRQGGDAFMMRIKVPGGVMTAAQVREIGVAADAFAEGQHVGPAQRAREVRVRLFFTEQYDAAQLGEPIAHLAQDLDVLAALVPDLGQEYGDAALFERVSRFGTAIGRIDVDQNRADLGRRELRDHPLDRVRRPDADAVAVTHSERHQAAREPVALRIQLGIGQTNALMNGNDRLVVRMTRGDPREVRADRLADQRQGTGSASVTQRPHSRRFGAQRSGPRRFGAQRPSALRRATGRPSAQPSFSS